MGGESTGSSSEGTETTATTASTSSTSGTTAGETTSTTATTTGTTGDPPGDPVVLVDPCVRCRQLVLDDTHVYFTALGPTNTDNAGYLAKVPKAGGEVTTLASGLIGPSDLAHRDGVVYWVDFKRGAVESVSVDGDGYTLITGEAIHPTDVDVDDLHVYWVDAGNAMQLDGSLSRAPVGGGPPEALIGGLDQPQTIAVVGESVVWVAGDAVWAMPKDGGVATMVVMDPHLPWTLVGEAGHLLYWTSKGPILGDGSIQRIDLLGGPIEPLVTGLDVPWDLAIDGDRIFWTNLEIDQTILYADKDGGDPLIALEDQIRPEGIAVDDTHIYWADFGTVPDFTSGRLARLPKS
ncbi:MAG: hypothetical protein R3B09_32045 [Nannocystaceae bacterium]